MKILPSPTEIKKSPEKSLKGTDKAVFNCVANGDRCNQIKALMYQSF